MCAYRSIYILVCVCICIYKHAHYNPVRHKASRVTFMPVTLAKSWEESRANTSKMLPGGKIALTCPYRHQESSLT